MMKVEPVTLVGKHVRLEPLKMEHSPDLLEAGKSEEVWRFLPNPQPQNLADMQAILKTALDFQAAGSRIPFATIDLESGRAIGTTSYLDIQPANRGIEIGWTWLGRAYWRTPRNTECKYLLMCHAFETLGAIRVQLKTDSRNYISQNAIERIGGVREGVLRHNMILYNGYLRDSVYFSILEREWPNAKMKLEAKLASYATAQV